jgi:hypothetical protein
VLQALDQIFRHVGIHRALPTRLVNESSAAINASPSERH